MKLLVFTVTVDLQVSDIKHEESLDKDAGLPYSHKSNKNHSWMYYLAVSNRLSATQESNVIQPILFFNNYEYK